MGVTWRSFKANPEWKTALKILFYSRNPVEAVA
jgi:hypothetical protein